ncbi:ABC transporter permease subunit [Tabrizicola sp.]|uniref:carbohydrate ABC transporter permease n=1 Tax=Tabrizicola sp. TaxID=2005166 RepID=UPI00260BFB71|nr:ABC transporter permease subunit [Tabrizicola sp.]MDM7933489.1 ABC transporter permease subunit [Tabrizicola sp.]
MTKANGGLSLSQQRQRAAFWFLAPMLAALCFVAAWPLIRTIWFSLTDTTLSDLYGGQWIGFDNYLSLRILESGRWVWVLTTFMRDLPVEIEEAAIVDGATPWIVITKVFLPLLWPALVTTGLLAFIGAWNEFLFALTFTSSETTRTVPVAIGLLSGASQQEIPWGPIMAASVIVTVPLIILVLIFQRKIVAGLTAGGVKG